MTDKKWYESVKDQKWYISARTKWSFREILVRVVVLFLVGSLAYFLHSVSSNWWLSNGLFLMATTFLINLAALPVYLLTKSHVVTVGVGLLFTILTYLWHNADAELTLRAEAKYRD